MWQRYVKAFLLTFGVGAAAAYAFIVLMDPYNSGRFGPQWIKGAVDADPRNGGVSRGRDGRFNSVVIGNSHAQEIDPSRLDEGTGLKFVQLSVPGAWAHEQLTMLRWFIRHHDRIGAVVLVGDSVWCTQDPALPNGYPFPFWLYSDSDVDYARSVLRMAALDRSWRRLLLAAGLRKESDPVGYLDYERERPWTFGEHARPIPDGFAPGGEPQPPQRSFPAIDQLKHLVAELPAGARFVVIVPPVYAGDLPRAGSPGAQLMSECKGALQALAGPGRFLDFAVDGPLMRDPANFMDETHYRGTLARPMERAIVAVLSSSGS